MNTTYFQMNVGFLQKKVNLFSLAKKYLKQALILIHQCRLTINYLTRSATTLFCNKPKTKFMNARVRFCLWRRIMDQPETHEHFSCSPALSIDLQNSFAWSCQFWNRFNSQNQRLQWRANFMNNLLNYFPHFLTSITLMQVCVCYTHCWKYTDFATCAHIFRMFQPWSCSSHILQNGRL